MNVAASERAANAPLGRRADRPLRRADSAVIVVVVQEDLLERGFATGQRRDRLAAPSAAISGRDLAGDLEPQRVRTACCDLTRPAAARELAAPGRRT